MIGDGDEHRIDQASLAFVRLASAKQQRDDIRVRRALHKVHEVVAADHDPISIDVRDRGAPAIHSTSL